MTVRLISLFPVMIDHRTCERKSAEMRGTEVYILWVTQQMNREIIQLLHLNSVVSICDLLHSSCMALTTLDSTIYSTVSSSRDCDSSSLVTRCVKVDEVIAEMIQQSASKMKLLQTRWIKCSLCKCVQGNCLHLKAQKVTFTQWLIMIIRTVVSLFFSLLPLFFSSLPSLRAANVIGAIRRWDENSSPLLHSPS